MQGKNYMYPECSDGILDLNWNFLPIMKHSYTVLYVNRGTVHVAISNGGSHIQCKHKQKKKELFPSSCTCACAITVHRMYVNQM